ncbi:hypothetical protein TNIN_326171 [Trichonephila inaurata madagascariensis]|uniref:Uncharacterized protein n=1 Tax=Trichonephila inaurata madagascariensis TaxID=2747483 RepID=A0A8X6YM72_9ARAC|nr:hypothetical protein TNIN_326171 [Trichonephila inaurata madagascariensis]
MKYSLVSFSRCTGDRLAVRTSEFFVPTSPSLFLKKPRISRRRSPATSRQTRRGYTMGLRPLHYDYSPSGIEDSRIKTMDNYPKATCSVSNPQASYIFSICQS